MVRCAAHCGSAVALPPEHSLAPRLYSALHACVGAPSRRLMNAPFVAHVLAYNLLLFGCFLAVDLVGVFQRQSHPSIFVGVPILLRFL